MRARDEELYSLARGRLRGRLQLGEAAAKFEAMEGAQRLGFSTPAQHTREQLGRKPRFVADCKRLAERLAELPLTRRALLDGHLGDAMVELLARKATAETERELLALARTPRVTVHAMRDFLAADPIDDEEKDPDFARTTIGEDRDSVEHLDEEVRAVKAVHRLGTRPRSLGPLTDDEMRQTVEFDRSVLSGDYVDALIQISAEGGDRDQEPYVDPNLPDLASSLHRNGSSGGEASIRIRTSEDQAAFYRAAREEWRRRRLPKNLLYALCLNFWLQWLSEVRASYTKWDPIHRRDGWKCQNPMCDRQVCTLHHIVFKALGGDDRWENLITLCENCHLEGIHDRESLLLFGEAPNQLTFVTEQWVVRGRDKRPAA